MRTARSVFIHIPKTGGKWINDVCRSLGTPIDGMPVYYDDTDHRVHAHTAFPGQKVFTFVRNPWAWYASAYEHVCRDIRIDTIKDFTNVTDFTFEKSVEIAMNIPLWTKIKLWQLRRDMYSVWLEEYEKEKQNRKSREYSAITYDVDVWKDLVKEQDLDLYSFFVKCYTANADQIGKTETVAQDLTAMLSSAGELTSEVEHRIATTPPVNTGGIADYRTYYNNHTHDLVATHCANMIETFNYKF